MSSPFSARSCLANPKSQMRMDSGFPDSSMYSMLLGFRSRCTTWEDGRICLTWGPGRSGKEKGRRQEVGVILESFILSRCCNRKQVCLDATPRGPSSSPSRKPGPLTVNEHLSDYTHTYTPTHLHACAHTHACAHKRIHAHTCTPMQHTYTHNSRTHVQYIHTCTRMDNTRMHTHVCTQMHARPTTKTCTHIHIYMHTQYAYAHTGTHTHTAHTPAHARTHVDTHLHIYTYAHT